MGGIASHRSGVESQVGESVVSRRDRAGSREQLGGQKSRSHRPDGSLDQPAGSSHAHRHRRRPTDPRVVRVTALKKRFPMQLKPSSEVRNVASKLSSILERNPARSLSHAVSQLSLNDRQVLKSSLNDIETIIPWLSPFCTFRQFSEVVIWKFGWS